MIQEKKDTDSVDMIYDYKTRPRWYLSILLGVQHFITMCTANALSTLILINLLCLENDSSKKSELISISFFMMGITTMMQTFFGTRLPIIQGSSFALLLPTLALMKAPEISSCNISNNDFIQARFKNQTMPESVFHVKMRLLGGAFMASSIVEILLGVTGLVKYLVRIISPLSLAAIYTVLSLSIVSELINMMAIQWAISLTGSIIMIIIIVVLAPIAVPLPGWSKIHGCMIYKVKVFEKIPIIIGISFVWGLCGILTILGLLPNSPTGYGYLARTDIKLKAFYEAPIFKMPYPMIWGSPMIIPSAIIGMSAGILISIIESLGDYMITAAVCKAPKIPEYAVCRGIFVEGIGVMLSGFFGSSVGPTSYSDNIGVLKITRAGNIVIAQVAAAIMLLCGVSPMIGALFVSIPDPAVGGVTIVISIMIMGIGITYLRDVNLKSLRNCLIFSLAVAFGIFIPSWCHKNCSKISVGLGPIDETIRILLSISVFIVTVLSVLLDNILPGNYRILQTVELEENSKDIKIKEEGDQLAAYDYFLLKWIAERCTFLQYLPIFPRYKPLESKNELDLDNLSVQNV